MGQCVSMADREDEFGGKGQEVGAKNEGDELPSLPLSPEAESIVEEEVSFQRMPMSGSVDPWFQQMLAVMNGMRQDMMVKFNAADSKLDNKFVEADSKLDNKFAEVDSKLDNKFVEADSKLNNKFVEADSKLNNKFVEVDSKLSEITQELDSKLSEITQELDSKFSEARQEMSVVQGQFSSVVSQVTALQEEIGTQNRDLRDILEKQSREMEDLRLSFMEKCKVTEERVNSVEARVTTQEQSTIRLSEDVDSCQIGLAIVQSDLEQLKLGVDVQLREIKEQISQPKLDKTTEPAVTVVVPEVQITERLAISEDSSDESQKSSYRKEKGEHHSKDQNKRKRWARNSSDVDSYCSGRRRAKRSRTRKHRSVLDDKDLTTSNTSSDSDSESWDCRPYRRRRNLRRGIGIWNVSANELHPEHLKYADAMTDNPAEWIAKVERHFHCLGQELDPTRVENLLVGDASSWYSMEAGNWHSWSQFKRQFLRHFRRSEVTLKKMLYAETQKTGESFVAYASRVDRVNKMLTHKLDDKGIINILRHGCHRNLRRAVVEGARKTRRLSKIIEWVTKEERILRMYWEKTKPSGDSVPSTSFNTSQLKKYERGQYPKQRDHSNMVGVAQTATEPKKKEKKGAPTVAKAAAVTVQTSGCQTDPVGVLRRDSQYRVGWRDQVRTERPWRRDSTRGNYNFRDFEHSDSWGRGNDGRYPRSPYPREQQTRNQSEPELGRQDARLSSGSGPTNSNRST